MASHEDREGGERGERGAFREGSFHAIHLNVHKRWIPFSYKISHNPLFSLFRHNRTIGCTRGWGKEGTRKVTTSSLHNALHYDCRPYWREIYPFTVVPPFFPNKPLSKTSAWYHLFPVWLICSFSNKKWANSWKIWLNPGRGMSMQKLTEPLVLN